MKGNWKSSDELVKKAFVRIEESYTRGRARPAGVPTGLSDFDEHFGGWTRGGLSVVGGRPASGKSSLLRTALLHAAESLDHPTAYVTLEDRAIDATDRLLTTCAQVPYRAMREAELEQYQWADLMKAAGRVAEAPIFFIDTPGLKIDNLERRVRTLVEEENLKAVFIDSLYGLEGSREDAGRRDAVDEITRTLGRLAAEYDLAIVVAVHIDEAAEMRPDKEPFPAELRHNQFVEDRAELICLLHRRPRRQASREVGDPVHVAVSKHPTGDLGRIVLRFDEECGRFLCSEPAEEERLVTVMEKHHVR